ncbi:MAG TPA: hypothetical protein VN643_18175 [Pyrinomonadaceae bacterium]|nr:hypothetical protein [Pyrinomonadaceae bacterium]
MSNLVLKIRLESLITNLDQVRRLADSVTTREQETQELGYVLEQAGKMIENLGTNVSVAQAFGIGSTEESPTKFKEYSEKVFSIIEELKSQMDDAKKLLDSIKDRLVPLGETLGTTLQNDLKVKTGDWLRGLNITRDRLNEALEGNGQQLLENAWKEVSVEKNQLIFSDYVDFLSGLALRDKGWDNSICQIADELISSCGNLLQSRMWEALTIPSSHGAVTLASIIRMGFPEWNLWGLPLAAHELGLVAVEVDNKLGAYLADQAGDDIQLRRQIQVCLADAFATCTMGPAYACAALLLRFDPRLAYEGRYDSVDDESLTLAFSTVLNSTLQQSGAETSFDEKMIETLNVKWKSELKATLSARRAKALSDAQRAYVILRVLNKMLDACGPGASFDPKIIGQLKVEWNSALEQAKPTGKLDSQSQLDTWVDYLFKYLSGNLLGAIYCGIPWTLTKDIVMSFVDSDPATEVVWTKEKYDELKGDNQNIKYVELSNTIELRDVINAAWACRIEGLARAEYTAEESDKINAAALKLWKCIKAKRNAELENPAVGRAGVRPVARSRQKK